MVSETEEIDDDDQAILAPMDMSEPVAAKIVDVAIDDEIE